MAILTGCVVVEDDTMISFKGQLLDRNGEVVEGIKIELVSTSINSQDQLEFIDFHPSRIDNLDVFDISNDEGRFQFFFPRSNLNLAIYIDVEQHIKFYDEDTERSYPFLIVEDAESLDSDFGALTLTPSE
ncbi:hypothetical protein [Psychroflexus montanilacus]|uniref:hypothetical protein n=1 Tax=Psychroflexus montanilacus TaxID=2873598 RepID=UPI001CCD6382|nr:hypothetical protein [Psychroflexus montanilacus]MBZ9651755.1 hypothetical protein [Psychroflexus montanilacus]